MLGWLTRSAAAENASAPPRSPENTPDNTAKVLTGRWLKFGAQQSAGPRRDGSWSLHFPVTFWLILAATIYATFLLLVHRGLGPTDSAYYNRLLDAFLHGRTDVIPAVTTDLSRYQGKWYLYWGPTPVLLVWPFYAVSGLGASDVVYDFVAGLGSVVVFAGCLREFVRYFRLRATAFSRVFVLLSFALASPNLFLSLAGTIWFVNQVVAVLYLVTFYFFFLKYLNTRRLAFLALAALFYDLAWIARPSLVFNGVLFLFPLLAWARDEWGHVRAYLGIVGAITALGLGCFFWYNQTRFGNPIEIGHRFQIADPRYTGDFAANRMLSLDYVPHNATYYFLNHLQLRFEPPYLQIDHEGNSIISVYPAFLLTLSFFRRRAYTRESLVLLALLGVALGLDFVVILTNLGSGWVQFGSRYVLDVVPGAFLALLFVVEEASVALRSALLGYGVLVNLLGVLVYFQVVTWSH
jgi:hypothetical protein